MYTSPQCGTTNCDQPTIGYAAALTAVVFLSFTAILIRHIYLLYEVQPLVLAFWRAFFVPCTVVPFIVVLRPTLLRPGSRNLPFLAAHGLILATFNALWTISVVLNGAAVATVLVYSSAAFTALLGHWLLHERLDVGRFIVIGLCLTGCILVSGAWSPVVWSVTPIATLVGVLSGLSYAAYSLMGRTASLRGLNPWSTLAYTFCFAAMILLFANLVGGDAVPGAAAHSTDLFALGNAWHGWGFVFLLAAGPTVIGFGLYNVSLTHLAASVANLVVTLEPVLTGILAFLLLDEVLTATQLVGSTLIVVGVAILRIQEGRRSHGHLPLSLTRT
ncbi:MAG: DMT family transporter [bacterium]|nr:DMT family transporter [bacterium]